MADDTRKKSLDDLHYIVIPDEILAPFLDGNGAFIQVAEEDNKPLHDAVLAFTHLKDNHIVNFSNISNTDLKLTYGAANLPELSMYDQNFVLLVRTLQSMGEYFYSLNKKETAKIMLEFAVSSGSDIINTYKLLAKIYEEEEDYTKINYLISSASLLNSLTKTPILKALNEIATQDSNLEENILDILD